jgi:hypothetical protein
MKAYVKATGETVEVKSKVITSLVTGKSLLKYVNQKTGISYFEEELCFPKDLTNDPDYWTRLKHQYAGMALQGLMAHTNIDYDEIVDLCVEFAHALVEKMKEEK